MMNLPLALTQGDPSGIGPELALKAWMQARADASVPPFFILADPDHLLRVRGILRLDCAIEITDAEHAASVFPNALPIVPLQAKAAGPFGAPTGVDTPSTVESITRAVGYVIDGRAAAIVTNPIAKSVLKASGFAYPGHTEFLAALAQTDGRKAPRAVMMLWSDELAVVPITIHAPFADVPRLLTRELIVETGLIVARDLAARFGVESPRLAFSGLNPHAGESGTMGREEIDIIAPAIADLMAAGIDARGPFPADTLFHAAARKAYDAALCMYHDQALIPIKTIAFDTGVNVTLGLPFIRTSPDHGTAFDIAGRGIANPASLTAALRLAGRLAENPSNRGGPA